eukprot:GILK01008364.1.p1 GENE.GILK01008364.1~~GILK01008364.1.p1  ORF type:complete len:734 (+),score=111.53 GILK01008364.1:114-2315(+)
METGSGKGETSSTSTTASQASQVAIDPASISDPELRARLFGPPVAPSSLGARRAALSAAAFDSSDSDDEDEDEDDEEELLSYVPEQHVRKPRTKPAPSPSASSKAPTAPPAVPVAPTTPFIPIAPIASIIPVAPPAAVPFAAPAKAESSEAAEACHMCNEKRVGALECTKSFLPDGKLCRKRFCFRCLKEHFGSSMDTFPPDKSGWECPSCRGICSCSSHKCYLFRIRMERENNAVQVLKVNDKRTAPERLEYQVMLSGPNGAPGAGIMTWEPVETLPRLSAEPLLRAFAGVPMPPPIRVEERLARLVEKKPIMLPSDMVCRICEQAGASLVCSGPCMRVFHAGCLAIKVATHIKWRCADCTTRIHECFYCKRRGEDTVQLRKCAAINCGNFYHSTCEKMLRLPNGINSVDTFGFKCSQHFCAACYQPLEDVPSGRCIRCPIAYHVQCRPVHSQLITATVLLCARHTPDEPRPSVRFLGAPADHRVFGPPPPLFDPNAPHTLPRVPYRGMSPAVVADAFQAAPYSTFRSYPQTQVPQLTPQQTIQSMYGVAAINPKSNEKFYIEEEYYPELREDERWSMLDSKELYIIRTGKRRKRLVDANLLGFATARDRVITTESAPSLVAFKDTREALSRYLGVISSTEPPSADPPTIPSASSSSEPVKPQPRMYNESKTAYFCPVWNMWRPLPAPAAAEPTASTVSMEVDTGVANAAGVAEPLTVIPVNNQQSESSGAS